MSEANNKPAKRSHQKNLFAFPTDLTIPESALSDRKFRSSYVRIFNDPRVYKRPRLNGDRTSSRFDVDYSQPITVVFNEPVVKRKSILANSTRNSKDDSSISKSVSFSSKITFIDSIDLDGVSSGWSDVEADDSRPNKSNAKSKTKQSNGKLDKKSKKAAAVKASNDKPSSKSKKKTKDKSASKNGHKVKSTQKDLFKFKITKPFRKFGRSKDKKLKHLQKKFGRRMFKAFVQVKRSFNLKTIPDLVTVPLEKITLKTGDDNDDVTTTTPKNVVPSIQDFLIGRMTKKVKVSLTPVHGGDTGGDTDEPMVIDTEIIQSKNSESNESNSIETAEDSSRTENDDQSDKPVDRQEMAQNSEDRKEMADDSEDTQEVVDNSETNQNSSVAPSTETINSDQSDQNGQSTKSNGDVVPAETDDCPDVNIDKCNDTEPSPEAAETTALPQLIDEITCSMYYNTNKDETVTVNGQMVGAEPDAQHRDNLDEENISTFNVSFTMPAKSLTDNILGCDTPEIASIQLEMND